MTPNPLFFARVRLRPTRSVSARGTVTSDLLQTVVKKSNFTYFPPIVDVWSAKFDYLLTDMNSVDYPNLFMPKNQFSWLGLNE